MLSRPVSRSTSYVECVPYSITPGSLALSRSVLDRAADRRRDEEWLAGAWAAPDTQVALLAGDRLAVTADRTGLRLIPPAEAGAGERIFLGIDRAAGAGRPAEGRAVFAVLLESEPDEGFATLREAGAVLDDREAGIAVNLVGLYHWHVTHPHCSRCGAVTVVAEAGTSGAVLSAVRRTSRAAIRPSSCWSRTTRIARCSAGARTGHRAATPPSPASSNRASRWRPPYAAKCWRRRGSSSAPTSGTRAASRGRCRPA
jgi:hypothetical protein